MWARFAVLSDTPIASAIVGCVIPLSRSNTIWMRWRCSGCPFQPSAVFKRRICFLVHLTICLSESDQMVRENHTATLKCNSPRQSVPQYRSTSIQSALETVLARWFFMTSITGRYTNSPESTMEFDLARLREVKDAAGFVAVIEQVCNESITPDYWTVILPGELA